ncbi:MAG: hypothetical protein HC799_02000 [Limnothrix sp. RL_2_0]|nr:hypothetical protein [Limnothrix sp. RL_2_0]
MGQNVQFLRRETTRRDQKIIEVRKAEKIKNLGNLLFFSNDSPDETLVRQLTSDNNRYKRMMIWRKLNRD